MPKITALLDDARAGAPGALDRLYEALYPDLHTLAHANGRPASSLIGLKVGK